MAVSVHWGYQKPPMAVGGLTASIGQPWGCCLPWGLPSNPSHSANPLASPSPGPWGLSKHPGASQSCATRVPAMFEIRLPATLQAFRGSRAGGQAAVVPAAGVPLTPHAPDGRCHTLRSPPGFRSATWCFHSSLTPLDGPHDTRAYWCQNSAGAAPCSFREWTP